MSSRWPRTDCLRAAQVALLPPDQRAEWDDGDGLCFRCGTHPSTRFLRRRRPAARTGVGFYTCGECRAEIRRTGGFERAGLGDRRLKLADVLHERRDRGLCVHCGAPAQFQEHLPVGAHARALAEILNSTVARLSTHEHCALCDSRSQPFCKRHPARRLLPGRDHCGRCRSLRPSASRRRRERILAALFAGGEPVSIAAGLRVGISSVRRAWQSLSPADRDRVRRARAERRERERAALSAQLLADYRVGSPISALCRRYRVSAVRIAAAIPAAERAKRRITDAERSLIRQLYGEGVAIQAIAARLHRAPCTVSEVLPAADRRPARHPSVLALDKVATPELLAEVARRYDAGTSARQIVKDMPDVTLALWERAVPPDRRRVRSRPLTLELRSAIVRRSRAGASVASLMVEFSITRSRIQAVLEGD